MDRFFSRFELKSTGTSANGKRMFSGTSTTPSTDRMGDVVEPKGAKFKLPLPFLWQHDSRDPIGWVTAARVTSKGIDIDGEIADIPDDGPLKERLATAWQMLVAKLVRGLSIGFTPLESEPIDPKNPWGPSRFLSWEWLELSAVTIAANQDASIQTIKSIDDQLLAATGRGQRSDSLPGAQGKNTSSNQSKGNRMKTLQDQLAALNEARDTKCARIKELGELKEKEGRSLNEDERAELTTLSDENQDIEDDIRIKSSQLDMSRKAVPVSKSEGARRSAGHTIIVKGSDADEKFKGQNFTRMIIAKALAHNMQKQGLLMNASDVAEYRWGKTNPTIVAILKANEVPGGGEGSGEWGHQLVQANNMYTGDFIEFLYGMTIFDRLPLREVPANVSIKSQDGAATGFWVGESKAIPNTNPTFNITSMLPLKVGAIAVCSNELLEDSSPAAEGLIRDALAEASAQRIDTTFVSADAASAGVSPAGILNGVSATAASGSDPAALRADLKAALATFDTAKDTGGLQIVTTRALARSISLMFNALGTAQEFPGTTPMGGTLLSYPVLVGDNVPAGDIIVLNPREIYKIGDMGVQVSISRDAMIEQSSAPTGATDTPVAASQVFTSMFQEESTAIKIVRRINFAKRRTTAVALISGGVYGNDES